MKGLLAAAGLAAGAVVAIPPAEAQDVLAPDAVARELTERFGVEVLEVERSDLGGSPTFTVKVMEPGGNSNSAFLVTTLAVDARTGEVISALRPASASPPGASFWSGADAAGMTIRRRTFGR